MTALHETLGWLVDIESVTGNEGRICTAISERLLPRWGLDGVARIGNSVVVGRPTGRPLLTLFGHTDTVPVQGNGAARVEGDRMYGVGTSDMKAGLAVMIHLLEDAEVVGGPYDVVGVFYDKEEGPAHENGLEDVLDRVPWLEESALAIVTEPTDLRLELGCNGLLNADVVFTGTAAHSSRPWLGDNAVTKAGEWLAAMHRREPEPVEVRGLWYAEVFSVTKAAGGIATNVIPATFTVNLNHRFPPIYEREAAEARLRQVAAAADEVMVKDFAPPGLIPEDNPHLDRLEQVLGAETAAKQGWTDVARLSARGVPAVNFGPGDPSVAHQAGEFVVLERLDRAFAGLKAFLVDG